MSNKVNSLSTNCHKELRPNLDPRALEFWGTVEQVSIKAYADDEHIYDSDNDPVRYRSETSMPF